VVACSIYQIKKLLKAIAIINYGYNFTKYQIKKLPKAIAITRLTATVGKYLKMVRALKLA